MSASVSLPLSGVRVIDLSDRLAGAYCTKLFVDAGAEVIKVEPPTGDPLRGRPSSIPHSPAAAGALFGYLCASKRSVVLDLDTAAGTEGIRQLLIGADLVVETWVPGEAERRGLSLDALRDIDPALCLLSISSFGRGGPRSNEDLPEFLLQALSGAIYTRGRPGRDPLHAAGDLAEWMAGATAAAAGMAALIGSARTGLGEHIDVSILEAAASSLVTAPVISKSLRGEPLRVSAARIVPSVERCADGWVGLYALTPQQWFDFTVMIESPELADDLSLASLLTRQARSDELVPYVEKWTTTRTIAEVLEMAQLLRLPSAPIGNGQTLPEFEATKGRGIYVRNPDGFRQPRSMFRFGTMSDRPIERAPVLGRHSVSECAAEPRRIERPAASQPASPGVRPLEGVRIVDLTAFWSGPYATTILGALGAEIIKIESIQHPDPLRFAGFFPPTADRWYEAAPLFNALNLDKKSLTLNVGSEEGRRLLLELVATADVVVENFTPRVLENFNLSYEVFAKAQQDIIVARSPAFGLDGPWRDRPGFAPTLEQLSGLAWINGYEDSEPMAPNGFVDPVAGAHFAFAILAALEHRRLTGEGMQIEVPMIDMVTTITAEQVIDYDLSGQIRTRHGNASPRATPQGVYVCAGEGDENWVALSVQTDDQWRALADVLAAWDWSEPAVADLDHGPGRWEQRDTIDGHLREWCAVRSASEICADLYKAGVPAAPVVAEHDIVFDEQMRARGFWERVPHPVIGDQWYAGLPFRRAEAHHYKRHTPLLGQDNATILKELGLSDEAIRDLEERRVIGQVPLGL